MKSVEIGSVRLQSVLFRVPESPLSKYHLRAPCERNPREVMSTAGIEGLSGAQRDELMDQVRQQLAIANAQELLTKMSDKCFRKCVSRPGGSLDSSEQKCVAMCMDRYMDSWNLVSRTFTNRLQRERHNL